MAKYRQPNPSDFNNSPRQNQPSRVTPVHKQHYPSSGGSSFRKFMTFLFLIALLLGISLLLVQNPDIWKQTKEFVTDFVPQVKQLTTSALPTSASPEKNKNEKINITIPSKLSPKKSTETAERLPQHPTPPASSPKPAPKATQVADKLPPIPDVPEYHFPTPEKNAPRPVVHVPAPKPAPDVSLQQVDDLLAEVERKGYKTPRPNTLGTLRSKVYEEAAQTLRHYAVLGDPQSQHLYAMTLATSTATPKDPEEAARWYYQASRKGYAPAQNNLGVLHEHGLGVAKNPDKAVQCYTPAAQQQCYPAILHLNSLSENAPYSYNPYLISHRRPLPPVELGLSSRDFTDSYFVTHLPKPRHMRYEKRSEIKPVPVVLANVQGEDTVVIHTKESLEYRTEEEQRRHARLDQFPVALPLNGETGISTRQELVSSSMPIPLVVEAPTALPADLPVALPADDFSEIPTPMPYFHRYSERHYDYSSEPLNITVTIQKSSPTASMVEELPAALPAYPLAMPTYPTAIPLPKVRLLETSVYTTPTTPARESVKQFKQVEPEPVLSRNLVLEPLAVASSPLPTGVETCSWIPPVSQTIEVAEFPLDQYPFSTPSSPAYIQTDYYPSPSYAIGLDYAYDAPTAYPLGIPTYPVAIPTFPTEQQIYTPFDTLHEDYVHTQYQLYSCSQYLSYPIPLTPQPLL